jgi:sigma-B regulation protein RsbU (phosphoserine phosphatase)
VRVLVVDDDAATRFLIASRLGNWGHQTAPAGNGREAWQMLNRDHYDLVISDWNMPEIDGLELCRLIRNMKGAPYRYIILCTANDRRGDFLTGMDAGADDFMVKPIDNDELRARVRVAERILELQAGLASQNRTLRKLNEQLKTAYETIQRDVSAAAAMQQRLLPEKPYVRNGLRLEWLMIASSFLAGDMMNYFPVNDRYLVFYQLDVSGHGIPAALLSVTLHQLLTAEPGSPIFDIHPGVDQSRILAPAKVVAELNRRFQGHDGQYFTILYGILDIDSGETRFCQAGHPMPFRHAADGVVSAVGEGGFPVGIWPAMEYDETVVHLLPGERLLLHSDGITECRNPAGEPYSAERLQVLIQRSGDCSLTDVMRLVQEEVTAWHGNAEFADDISLLALERVSREA